MTFTPGTYTTEEARILLSFKARERLHELARRWPAAFVRVHGGSLSPKHQNDPTLWDVDNVRRVYRLAQRRKEIQRG